MGKVCCFAGHSNMAVTNELHKELTELIEKLITEEGVTKFRVGHYGDFDGLCGRTVRKAKEKYNDIHLDLLVPYITAPIRDLKIYFKENYDSLTVANVPENTPKRFYITKCNEYMIDVSDFLICYVNRSFGGARHTLDYAKRKKHIKIYNLAEKRT